MSLQYPLNNYPNVDQCHTLPLFHEVEWRETNHLEQVGVWFQRKKGQHMSYQETKSIQSHFAGWWRKYEARMYKFPYIAQTIRFISLFM